MSKSTPVGRLLRVGALALAASIAGCAPGDVELNGGVFDYLGVGAKSQGQRSTARLEPRAGIVVPPNTERLPEPGSGTETGSVTGVGSWPVDPEVQKAAAASDTDRRHAAFCQDALWRSRIKNDPSPVMGPNGVCNPSVLNAVSTNTSLQRPKEGAPDPLSQMPSTFKKQ